MKRIKKYLMTLQRSKLWIFSFLILNYFSFSLFGDTITVSLSFPRQKLKIQEVEWKGKQVVKLRIEWSSPKFYRHYTIEPCKPAIPYLKFYVAIPFGNEITNVQVILKDSTIIPLKYIIEPARYPRPLRITKPGEPPPFVPETVLDSTIYASNRPYPGVFVKVGHKSSIYEYERVAFFIYPIQYLPAMNTLIFYTEVQVKITHEAKKNVNLRKEPPPKDIFLYKEDYLKRLNSLKMNVVNPDDVHIPPKRINFFFNPEEIPYAIITEEGFVWPWEELRVWRKKGDCMILW